MRRLLLVLLTIAASACASTGAIPRPFPSPGRATAATPSAPPIGSPGKSHRRAADGYAIAGTALGTSRGTVQKRRQRSVGVRLQRLRLVRLRPARRACAADGGRTVPRGHEVRSDRSSQPGDLVFFDTDAGRVATHVGIAIGGDEFVHAPSSRGEVRVERLERAYWATALRRSAPRPVISSCRFIAIAHRGLCGPVLALAGQTPCAALGELAHVQIVFGVERRLRQRLERLDLHDAVGRRHVHRLHVALRERRKILERRRDHAAVPRGERGEVVTAGNRTATDRRRTSDSRRPSPATSS